MVKFLVVSGLLASTVVAHGGVVGYTLNGKWYKGFTPYNNPTGQKSIEREWATFNPIEKPDSPAIVCNTPGTPAKESAPVAAGSKATVYWNSYSHDIGPLLMWMTECPGTSCETWDAKGGKWFKIDESGLLSGTVGKGKWGSGDMIKNNHSWSFTIPPTLKAGSYLLRTESIAMHSTNPQFYPNCAHVKVTGTGTASPPASYRASIPGVYKASDPAWAQPVWSGEQQAKTSFKIPGPKVWKGN